MTQAAVHSPSRPFNPWLFLALPLGLAALLLAFEPVTLDLALANLMYDPGAGFIGRHSWFLENILHDRVKQLVIAISVLGLLVSIAGLFHRPWRAAGLCVPRHEPCSQHSHSAQGAHRRAVPLEPGAVRRRGNL